MQLLVFGAFVIVLSVPEAGPPWVTITSPLLTWAVVVGQVGLAAGVGAVYSRLVRRKLDREPAWLPGAQRRLAQGTMLTRLAVAVGFTTAVFLTDWARMVRGWPGISRVWGLDEVIILLPFFAGILASWIALYPADVAVRRVAIELRLWASVPAHPVWRLGKYLNFMFRQHVLIIAAPMLPIVIAYDASTRYARGLYELTGVPWAHEAIVVATAGVVFFFAPIMLCRIWHTRPLPPGELRDRLEAFCARVGMRYRRILIWESDGMVVNAAVMGLVRPVRYILLSDGLIEMMDDRKIEAVFGHEAGHVKHHHIPYYFLFAVLSMLIVGGVMELAQFAMQQRPDLVPFSYEQAAGYLQMSAMLLIIVIWGLGFGAVSRRFEWQADLFGARSVTPTAERCDHPCLVHGTALVPEDRPPGPAEGLVCASAASLFADALHRIASLNGIPVEARSWRHSSIANRMRRLRRYAHNPAFAAQLERSVRLIKIALLIGTTLGVAIGIWLYRSAVQEALSGAWSLLDRL